MQQLTLKLEQLGLVLSLGMLKLNLEGPFQKDNCPFVPSVAKVKIVDIAVD